MFPIATFSWESDLWVPKVEVPNIIFAFSSSDFSMKLSNGFNSASNFDVIRIAIIFS